MKSYKSFDEMAKGTGALEFDSGINFVDNMSPKFVTIPPFQGKRFYVWADEKSHGGNIEKPHVHIKLQEGEVKCWISEVPNRNKVIPDHQNCHLDPHLMGEVAKHLQENWDSVAREWNTFIDTYYPEFKNDKQSKIPVGEADDD